MFSSLLNVKKKIRQHNTFAIDVGERNYNKAKNICVCTHNENKTPECKSGVEPSQGHCCSCLWRADFDSRRIQQFGFKWSMVMSPFVCRQTLTVHRPKTCSIQSTYTRYLLITNSGMDYNSTKSNDSIVFVLHWDWHWHWHAASPTWSKGAASGM